jgi:hypothetical protein
MVNPVGPYSRLGKEMVVLMAGFGGSVLARVDSGKLVTELAMDGKTTHAWPLGEGEWLAAKHSGDSYALQVGMGENGTFKVARDLETVNANMGWTLPVDVLPMGKQWLVVLIDQHTEEGADSSTKVLTSPPNWTGPESFDIDGQWLGQQNIRLVALDAETLETVWSQVHEAPLVMPKIHDAPVAIHVQESGAIRVQWVTPDGVSWADVTEKGEPKVKTQAFEVEVREAIHGTRLTKSGSDKPGQIVWWDAGRLVVAEGTKGDWRVRVVTVDALAAK